MGARDDLRARYLRQQAELGGAEVVLDRGTEGQRDRGTGAEVLRDRNTTASVTAEPEDLGAEDPSGPDEAADQPAAPVSSRLNPQPPGAPARHWRQNLPAIPGPGITVHPPEIVLLGGPIAECESLEAVAGLIAGCRKCTLCQERTNTVPGEGNPRATLMCVGEGPGANEDQLGRPFVGAAGKLLDQILAAIECPRETVYIANIVKCRPPGNRKPLPDEAAACLPYLHRQIALVKPKVLLALGGTAAEHLLGVKQSLGALRGQVHRYGEIPLIVTYHPAALLRNPNWKKPTWEDVRVARQLLGE